jgi:hypothetical protein
VPQLVRGAALAEAQAAFAAATAGGTGTVSLVEHVGAFLRVLALPELLELAGELMPTRYEGTPQCVSLTGHTAPSSGGWRRDYSRPARDIVLLGPPAPPQHMADECPRPPGAVKRPQRSLVFPIEIQFCMALLYGRAGRLTSLLGVFWQ